MKKPSYIYKKVPVTECANVTNNVVQQLGSILPMLNTSRFLMVAMATFTIVAIDAPNPAHTQTLDQAIQAQLSGDCMGLGLFNGNTSNPGTLGDNLNAICISSNVPSSGTSTGGGAGSSPQTLAVSVENRRKERLEEEREIGESSTANSASFNFGRGLSMFVTGNFEKLNRDRTTFADGFNSDIALVSVGADKLISNQLLAGLAFTYTSTNGEFDGGGGFNTNSYGGTFYGSFFPTPESFIDLSAGFSRKDYNVSRAASFTEDFFPPNTFSGTINSDTKGNEISVRGILGHDYTVGNIAIGPRLGFNWTNTHIEDYSERDGGAGGSGGAAGLALRFDDQYINSLQSVVGVQGSAAISTGIGVLVPQVNADYIHEFANSQRSVIVQFVEDLRQNPSRFRFQTEKPVRDFFNLGIGMVAVLPHGIQPFVKFRAMVGNEQFTNYAGSFGVRIEL